MAVCAASSHPLFDMPMTSMILAIDDMHPVERFFIYGLLKKEIEYSLEGVPFLNFVAYHTACLQAKY
jgi:hypothetical protein